MPSKLDINAKDQSTFVITLTFKDEDGNLVAPDTAKWTLTDKDGNVINNRQDVEIVSPSSVEEIVLKGDDLKYSDGSIRILAIEATYTSSLGTGLPLNDSITFAVEDIKAV